MDSFNVNYIEPQTFHILYDLQRINNNNNTIYYSIGGTQYSKTLINGNYDQASFITTINGVFAGTNITFNSTGNKLNAVNNTGSQIIFSYSQNSSSLNNILGLT